MLLFAITLLFLSQTIGSSGQSLSSTVTRVTRSAGGSVYFECHLDDGGVDAGGFSWTGPALVDLGGRVTVDNGRTVSTLHITDIGEEDKGVYTCRHETVASPLEFNLRVRVYPRFLGEQQREYRVPEGADAVLPCRAASCRSCTMDWFRNRRDSLPSNSEQMNSREGDLVTHTLTLTNVRQEHAGTYNCYIFEISKNLSFTLTVVPLDQRVPLLNKSIAYSYKEVYFRDPLVLRCPVRSGENTTDNPLTVRWTFTNIYQEPQHVPGLELRISQLYVRGIYKCTASNSVGSDSLEIFVEVIAPPLPAVVTLPPLTLQEGSPHEVLCSAPPEYPVASHALSYLWEVNRAGLWMITTGDKYHLSHLGHLSIVNVSLSDAGTYRVTVSNSNGSSVQTRRVDVSPAPTPGEPVAIGFAFELPELLSCLELQESSNLLTDYLMNYLETLCSNNSSISDDMCSNIQLRDVAITCDTSRRRAGTFRARLASSRAESLVRVFEQSGPVEITENISIDPCEEGRCVDPTEVTKLKDLVAVLCVIIALLIAVMVATTCCVACLLKHKGYCYSKNRVFDVETPTQVSTAFKRSISLPSHLPPHSHQPHHPHEPHYPHTTAEQDCEPRYVEHGSYI